MGTLKYKIIKNKTQYKEYCKTLEALVATSSKSKAMGEEIELITILIEKWDEEHNTFDDLDPIELLHSLMEDHNLKAKDLVKILNVSKGLISDILNYKKGLSKEIIRTLSEHFKIGQEAFNRSYRIKSPVTSHT
jgi:HTH-type transcriptional regulator / antitoxin HigA